MKKVLTFIAIICLPLLAAGQNDTSVSVKSNEQITVKAVVKKKTVLKSETKAQIINLNHKKSIDLISIKAYRKSLQIKVKTIKMC